MCDSFLLQRMDNYQGDLADIIRAGSGPISGTLGSTTTSSSGDLQPTVENSWQFNQSSDPMIYHSDDFGHPFYSLRDPLLLEELDSSFFTSSNSVDQDSSGFCGGSSNIFAGDHNNKNIEDQQEDQIKRAAACNNNNNHNIFSRILQISPNNNVKLPIPPCESPVTEPRVVLKPPPSNSTLICNVIENTGLQISSPRNTGIKRR